MDDREKIATVRTMTNSEDTDTVLSIYLKLAARKIIDRVYPYDRDATEVPNQYDLLQCEIASYLLNKRGAEGQIAHSENGISRQYESADVPDSMLRAITPYCGVIK